MLEFASLSSEANYRITVLTECVQRSIFLNWLVVVFIIVLIEVVLLLEVASLIIFVSCKRRAVFRLSMYLFSHCFVVCIVLKENINK